MSDRQPILPGACSNFCFVEESMQESLEIYAVQPSLTVGVEFEDGGTVYVSRDIGDRSELIGDPQPVIDGIVGKLEQRPCDFTRSGLCRAAQLLVNSSLNVKLYRQ